MEFVLFNSYLQCKIETFLKILFTLFYFKRNVHDNSRLYILAEISDIIYRLVFD